MIDPAKTVRFIVQHFNEPAQEWLSINDRIFVRDYLRPGTNYLDGVARAQKEADKQVSGWQAGYPLRQYRALAADY